MRSNNQLSSGARATAKRNGAGGKGKRKQINQAGRPTAGELEKRKIRAMEVATELFIAHGYAGTSLVDIAKGAGCATRTLYQHFGDKEAMFREVVFARDRRDAVEPPTTMPGDTIASALGRAARYTYEYAFEDRAVGLMRLMIAEGNRFPDFMQSVGGAIFGRFRRNIEVVFRELAAAGLIPNDDHKRSTELFADLILGSRPIMTYTNWAGGPPDDEDLDERIDLFILGRFGSTVARTARTRKMKGMRAEGDRPKVKAAGDEVQAA